MKFVLILLLSISFSTSGQDLKIRPRSADAVSGSAFAASVRDTSISLAERDKLIFNQIKAGNIPDFYRKLKEIRDTSVVNGIVHTISYYVIPDFIAIGSDDDYFYCPMKPQTAQKIANLLKCRLPTRKISDRIYQRAIVKMVPEPIPPSPAMTTVPVFEKHNQLVQSQRNRSLRDHPLGSLVAGNKKAVIISNKIFNDKGILRVVIYGWHKPDGKAIQPLYNGHTPLHVDYSHGIRLVQNKVWVDGRQTSIKKLLASEELNSLLSDEGKIILRYPTK